MYVLDSNILISYLNDDEAAVSQFVSWRKEGAKFIISAITEVEILSLPRLNSEDVSKIKRFLGEFTIIPLDSQLAQAAAAIRRNSKLSLGDSVVIATVELTNSVLVTNDAEILKKAKGIRLKSIH